MLAAAAAAAASGSNSLYKQEKETRAKLFPHEPPM